MAKFLSGKDLEEAIYNVIFKAEKYIIIISPYIKLDSYFREALFDKHLNNSKLKIYIVFGKNERQVNKSFNVEDFDYFKKFPNISITYAPNLHAKYYTNEKQAIITSLNMYDTSFKKNIEFGVQCESSIIGIENVYLDAYNKSADIIEGNYLVFLKQPLYKKNLISKDYVGSKIVYDVTQQLIDTGKVPQKSVNNFEDQEALRMTERKERVSREMFEAQHKSILIREQESSTKIVKPKVELKGHCIRCGKPIPLNIKVPYCSICYKDWHLTKKEFIVERYCHICGKEHSSSKKRPAHFECYNDRKKV